MKQKRLVIPSISILAAVILLLCSSSIFAKTGFVNTTTLYVRNEPSTNSVVISYVGEDEKLDIIGEEGNWYKIQKDNMVGYVSKDYVTIGDSPVKKNEVVNSQNTQENNVTNEENNAAEENTVGSGQTQEPQDEPVESFKTDEKVKTKENVSVYIMPLFNTNIIEELEKGEELKVISTAGAWSYVQNDEISGWIPNSKLENI